MENTVVEMTFKNLFGIDPYLAKHFMYPKLNILNKYTHL